MAKGGERSGVSVAEPGMGPTRDEKTWKLVSWLAHRDSRVSVGESVARTGHSVRGREQEGEGSQAVCRKWKSCSGEAAGASHAGVQSSDRASDVDEKRRNPRKRTGSSHKKEAATCGQTKRGLDSGESRTTNWVGVLMMTSAVFVRKGRTLILAVDRSLEIWTEDVVEGRGASEGEWGYVTAAGKGVGGCRLPKSGSTGPGT